MPVCCKRVPSVDAGGRRVIGATQEGKGNVAVYRSGHTTKLQSDDFVRIGMDAVFHLGALKPAYAQRDATDPYPGANTKKQMSCSLGSVVIPFCGIFAPGMDGPAGGVGPPRKLRMSPRLPKSRDFLREGETDAANRYNLR